MSRILRQLRLVAIPYADWFTFYEIYYALRKTYASALGIIAFPMFCRPAPRD